MVRWAGRLLVFYGLAHTFGALVWERAATHAGAWFTGALWGEDLADMGAASSAYWLSVNSFGPPLVLLGSLVIWLDRRGVTPPAFLAWALGGWTAVDAVASGSTPWPVAALATTLLAVGIHRDGRADAATQASRQPSSSTP